MKPESLQILKDFTETKMAPSLPMLREAVREIIDWNKKLTEENESLGYDLSESGDRPLY